MPTLELVATDPAQVGPYRLLHRLGSGGMGVVYLGEAPGGELVAVKCLPHGVGGDVRSRLRREAAFLSAVDHPRVAAFVAADTHAGRPWIAMQYVAGPSLAQASVPLGPAQLRHLTEGLADALAALHRQGLTHRDVKPGNIILTHDGPVLVDLGIAVGGELTALTAVGMVVGTPEWMAPEQFTGQGSGPAVDLWGWASVATYAATGRAPFGTGAIEALAHRIRYEQPDLRGVPEWLRGAVLAALAKDHRARPAAVDLAAVDGIRRVGTRLAAVRSVPPAGPPVPPTLLAPPMPAPPMPAPARGPVPPPSGSPRGAVPPPRGPVAPQRDGRPRPAGPVAAPRPTSRPTSRPPKRRSLVRRLLRRLLLTAVLLAVLAGCAVAAYAWARQELSDVPWRQTFDELRRSVGG
ncbi:Serine/threonine protein kinase [Jatrophihabitans endophyticus]|uniref:Serine/threonine protein kinase n=1 Tax=Jatrophihabitans endophyticus TaxID=1206085 RepID=A0A1M5E2R3_9ACTN|nr:serine/threonine-protein kinase [Jatrophihabitans endophyticus]SHF73519.1 Serine/threonine protein kinase [Jatrophihabitans endophyticus]